MWLMLVCLCCGRGWHGELVHGGVVGVGAGVSWQWR